MNILFTGMRGSGKTTVGKALAAALAWPFCDVDEEIARAYGQSVREMVEHGGWPLFRTREHDALKTLLARNQHVIATGGGALVQPRNAALVQQHCVILLEVPVSELARRLAHDARADQRPALTSARSLAEELGSVWKAREPSYRKVAHITVRADQPVAASVQTIFDHLSQHAL